MHLNGEALHGVTRGFYLLVRTAGDLYERGVVDTAACGANSHGFCIPNMLKQFHPHAGGLRWLGVL